MLQVAIKNTGTKKTSSVKFTNEVEVEVSGGLENA